MSCVVTHAPVILVSTQEVEAGGSPGSAQPVFPPKSEVGEPRGALTEHSALRFAHVVHIRVQDSPGIRCVYEVGGEQYRAPGFSQDLCGFAQWTPLLCINGPEEIGDNPAQPWSFSIPMLP